MIILPITLAAAGAAALVNFWLSWRIGEIRTAEKISIGDGGNPKLIARMRAQLNFAEYVPVVLILTGLIEAARGTHWWLGAIAGVFVLGRALHPLGMDGWSFGRTFGMATTALTMVGLGIYALVIAVTALI